MERQSQDPSLYQLIAAEIVFGVAARDLFPVLHQKIESDVVERAHILDRQLFEQDSESRRVTRTLLAIIITRAADNSQNSCLQQLSLFE